MFMSSIITLFAFYATTGTPIAKALVYLRIKVLHINFYYSLVTDVQDLEGLCSRDVFLSFQ